MATQKFVVTGEQYRVVDQRMREIKRQLDQKNGSPLDPYWVANKLQEIVEPLTVVKKPWLGQILANEQAYHVAFFGREFDYTDFINTLKKYDESTVRFWRSLGLEPHFLPKISLRQDDDYPGWKIKPEKWFYEKIADGKIFSNIAGKLTAVNGVGLQGIAVLIDTRLKPIFENSKQVWADDGALGCIIEELRKGDKIAKYEYGSQSSRFGVSADGWETEIKPAWAKRLQLETNRVRLELFEEANVIPQIYLQMPRKADGQTDTSVWYEQYFEDRTEYCFGESDLRLYGGHSLHGGLAYVSPSQAINQLDSSRAFRPLAVL